MITDLKFVAKSNDGWFLCLVCQDISFHCFVMCILIRADSKFVLLHKGKDNDVTKWSKPSTSGTHMFSIDDKKLTLRRRCQ